MGSKGWDKGTAFSKRLRINSSNRLNLSDPDTNFTVNLGNNLQQTVKISVVSAQFTNAFYNVFSTPTKYNNRFIISGVDGSGKDDFPITITPGRYSVSTLFAAIATAVNATTFGAITLTFAIDPITNLASVYATAPTYTQVSVDAPTAPLPNVYPKQDYWPFGILGFLKPSVISLNSSAATIATYFPNLNNPSIVYITSNALAPTNSFDEEGKTSNILLPIDITAPFLGLQTYECKVDGLYEIDYGKPRPLGIIDIQLVDHDLDPLDLHQTELNLELRVWTNYY